MQDAIEFKDVSFTQVGKDYRFIGYQNIGKYKENKSYLYVPINGLQKGAMKSEVWISMIH